jgi:hypothetical protein
MLPESPSGELAASLVGKRCQPALSVIYDDECAFSKLLRWKPPGLDFSVGSGSADARPLAELVDGKNALERLLNILLIHVAPDWKLMVPDIELQDASC